MSAQLEGFLRSKHAFLDSKTGDPVTREEGLEVLLKIVYVWSDLQCIMNERWDAQGHLERSSLRSTAEALCELLINWADECTAELEDIVGRPPSPSIGSAEQSPSASVMPELQPLLDEVDTPGAGPSCSGPVRAPPERQAPQRRAPQLPPISRRFLDAVQRRSRESSQLQTYVDESNRPPATQHDEQVQLALEVHVRVGEDAPRVRARLQQKRAQKAQDLAASRSASAAPAAIMDRLPVLPAPAPPRPPSPPSTRARVAQKQLAGGKKKRKVTTRAAKPSNKHAKTLSAAKAQLSRSRWDIPGLNDQGGAGPDYLWGI